MISKSFSIGGLTYYIIIPELDSSYTITACTLNWTQVASENGTGNVGSLPAICRYGLTDTWAYRWYSGNVTFSNTVWGDPYQGAAKVGQYASSASVTVTPTPTNSYTTFIAQYSTTINVLPGNYAGTIKATRSGLNFSLEAVQRPGYAFAGWYNGTTLLTNKLNYSFSLNSNITLTAQFKEILPGLYIKINGH